MSKKKQSSKFIQKIKAFIGRHKQFFIYLGLFIITVIVLLIMSVLENARKAAFQVSISGFYDTTGLSMQGALGEVVRSEPLTSNLTNGTATRVLYRTQRADGTNTFSSGMVFVPKAPAVSPRPVMAWAHGTMGMGDDCAPSRQEGIVSPGMSWVSAMLNRGWIVTATDYTGFGTPGTQAYLVGSAEAHDVLNSVRAAHQLAGTQASSSYAIWGHSQGGHAALFSASLASEYMPEYQLVGTAATAPAAQLTSLLKQQFNSATDWVIGPEIALSWPDNYSDAQVSEVLTTPAINNYQSTAQACISDAAIAGIIRNKLGQKFFTTELTAVPSWNAIIVAQTAPTLSPTQPLFVGESLTDQVVLPDTTAQYIQRACNAGSNLTSMWLTDVGHIQLLSVISPSVINWLGDRFAGRPSSPTCYQPLPISPAQD